MSMEEDIIRIHYDDRYKVISFPKTFDELKKEILLLYKNIKDFSAFIVTMIFGKTKSIECKDEKSFKEIIDKKANIFLEFLVEIRAEKADDVRKLIQLSDRKEYDVILENSNKIYRIIKGLDEHNIFVTLVNFGQKKWELKRGEMTLSFVSGERYVVANDCVIGKDVDVEGKIDICIHLYDLHKLKQDTEHVLKMQLKQGLNKIGDELKIKFMFCDDA